MKSNLLEDKSFLFHRTREWGPQKALLETLKGAGHELAKKKKKKRSFPSMVVLLHILLS